MKKVLILAYDFEPHNSIGAQRPLSWFKYFKEFGLHPVVVTRHWDSITKPNDLVKASKQQQVITEETEFGTVVRVPYRPNLRDRILLRYGMDKFVFVRKILSLIYAIGQFKTFIIDNRQSLYKEGFKQLINNNFCAIIATGEPFILFRYASLLSKQFDIPWIADYRDGWSRNYSALEGGSRLQKWINENIFSSIERKLISTASLCTFTVKSHRNEVKEILPSVKAEIVMNGYFEELFSSLPEIDYSNKPFRISYSGTIYPYQQLETFLYGLQTLITEKNLTPEDLELVFYGLDYQPEQFQRVLNYSESLKPFIKTTARIPLKEMILELNKANAFLLLATSSRQQIYAKVFDYIALKKPILLCTSDNGPLEQLVNETPSPCVANSESEVASLIWKLMNSELGSSEENSSFSERYSRRNQAKKMAELILGLTE